MWIFMWMSALLRDGTSAPPEAASLENTTIGSAIVARTTEYIPALGGAHNGTSDEAAETARPIPE